MQDWSMYELNNIVWSESDDHIVPQPGAERKDKIVAHSDCGKKAKREIATVRKTSISESVTKDGIQNEEICCPTLKDRKDPMLGKGSWSRMPNSLYFDSGNIDLIKQNATHSFNDDKKSSNCVKNNNINSFGNEFCGDGIIGNRGAALDENLCRFLLGDISPTGSDLVSFDSECEDKDRSNLSYYGWPDIGNFEEVDKMIRSCDSTFVQGDASYDNELSWFSSSSHAIDGCEDAMKSGFSCPEWKSTSKNSGSAMGFMSDNLMPLITDFDKKNVLGTYRTNTQSLNADDSATLDHSYNQWLDTEDEERNISLHIKQINLQGKQSNDQHQSGKRKEQSSEYSVGDSQAVLRRKQNFAADSLSYLDECIPNDQFKYNTSFKNTITPATSSITSEISIQPSPSLKDFSYASNHTLHMETSAYPSPKATAMTSEQKIEKSHQHEPMPGTMNIISEHEDFVVRQAQAVFADQVPSHKQLQQIHNGAGGHIGVDRTNKKLPAEVDLSIAQKSTCASVLSDDVSLEATSFWNLQCILEQLDIGTKRCIRDSLYRLARSAEDRQQFEDSNGNGRDNRDRSGLLTTEETFKSLGFMDIEADTNPIDRSIAHLLFYKPSDNQSSRVSSDALPVESCAARSSCTLSSKSSGLNLMFC